jgi:hypothetical protein
VKYQMVVLALDEGIYVPQGAEPAWFAAAMTQVLTPIQVDIAELKDDIAELTARVTQVSVG